MSIKAGDVKELRERTGAGMMDCKRALEACDGDFERAVAQLREKGLAGAAKKAGRVAADGLVGVCASPDGRAASMVELNCETDFVAKNEQFAALLDSIAEGILGAELPGAGDGEAAASVVVADGKNVADSVTEAVAGLGEKIELRRFVRLESASGRLGSYVHAGGKIGVLVEISGASEAHADLLKSLAMQVAAAYPRYVRRDEVPAADIEREREIFRAQALSSGKPEKVVDRIVDGKLEKFYKEVCLVEQDYVRDPDTTIGKLLERASKDGGTKLVIERFARFQLGEGIEKAESNLAEEVAAQIAQG